MDFEGIMLSEMSQTKKDKYCMISYICGIWETSKQHKNKTHKPLTENILVVARGRVRSGQKRVKGAKMYKSLVIKHTHIFFLLVGTLIINICVLWSVQRGPSLYVWSLHKRLFCLCFSWSYSRCLSILGSRWAQGLTWRIVGRSVVRTVVGRNVGRISGVSSSTIGCFLFFFILWVVVED